MLGSVSFFDTVYSIFISKIYITIVRPLTVVNAPYIIEDFTPPTNDVKPRLVILFSNTLKTT